MKLSLYCDSIWHITQPHNLHPRLHVHHLLHGEILSPRDMAIIRRIAVLQLNPLFIERFAKTVSARARPRGEVLGLAAVLQVGNGGAASCSACDLLRRLPEKAVDDG